MARIAGIDLPKNKRSVVGLTYIYGIGRTTAEKLLKAAGISEDKKIADLTEDEITQIRGFITADYKVEGVARSEMQLSPSPRTSGSWPAHAYQLAYP
jgi:small subunit ribosomal protein S13